MLDLISVFGEAVTRSILGLAHLLVHPAAPGLVSVGLVLALVIGCGIYGVQVQRRLRAVRWLRARITTQADGAALSAGIDTLTEELRAEAAGRPARADLVEAWDEYRETLVVHEGEDGPRLRNAVRPALFFNVDDLHFGPGVWRAVPGLFVMVGLFFTFLGLIAALGEVQFDTPAAVQASLKRLLSVASAKFIMSLTGLFCSILFTIVLRRGIARTEEATHRLAITLEKRLTFLSLEGLATEQLRALRAQGEQVRGFGRELSEDLGRRLREELAPAISGAIGTSMAPLLREVGQVGAEGMGTMVRDLSSRFSEDVGRALKEASDRLAEAGGRIGQLAERMDQSSGRMGSEMEGAVQRVAGSVEDLRGAMTESADLTAGALAKGADQLLAVMNQTLEGIRDNTGAGARAMSEAAADLKGAAEAFRAEFAAASREASEAARVRMEAASGEASATLGEAGRVVRESVGQIGSEMASAVDRIARAGDAMRDQMATSAEAANGVFAKGADQLLAVMNQTLEGIRDNTGAGARAMSEAASDLKGAAEAFRAEFAAASREASEAARVRMAAASGEASATLGEAGRVVRESVGQIGSEMASAVDRIARAGDAMRDQMATSAEAANGVFARGADQLLAVMNQTLEGIRDNTGAGARAMSEAASDLKGAAEAFRSEISSASREASDAVRARLADAGTEASGRVDDASRQMLEAVARSGAGMDAAVLRLAEAVSGIQATMGASAATTSDAMARGTDQLLAVMNQTLEGIRDNTGAGARAMSAAAADLKGAAEAFRSEISAASREAADAARDRLAAAGAEAGGLIGDAGRQMLDVVGRTGAELFKAGEALTEKAGQDLLAPLGRISGELGAVADVIGENAAGLRSLSAGVRAGADAAATAAVTFRTSATDLVGAVAPIRQANERMEGAVRQMSDSVTTAAGTVIRASEETARSAAAVLAAAEAALGGHARAIETSLGAVSVMLERLRHQGAELDDIDARLGRAFDQYTTQVATAVDGLFGHVRAMQAELQPALDTLRAVVEQAEQFAPERRRR